MLEFIDAHAFTAGFSTLFTFLAFLAFLAVLAVCYIPISLLIPFSASMLVFNSRSVGYLVQLYGCNDRLRQGYQCLTWSLRFHTCLRCRLRTFMWWNAPMAEFMLGLGALSLDV